MRLIPSIDKVKQPHWYGALATLYTDAPVEKRKINSASELQRQELVEEGPNGLVLTSDGLNAYNEFRNQRLKYAGINTTGMVSLLVAIIAAASSIILSKDFTGYWNGAAIVAVVLILVVTAVVIQITLSHALK